MNKNFIILVLGLMIIPCVSATEFDTFTLQMVDLIKLFVILVGLVIVVLATYTFFAGGPSMLRLIVIMAYVGITILILLIFAPIVIDFIRTTIG